jgi:uncharacterized RDD family membrane protein YckC
MTLREQYLSDVAKNITAHPERKDQFLLDLRAHFDEGKAAGDTDIAVINRLGKPEDVASEFMMNMPLTFAGFWERLLAFFIDMTLCVYVMIFGFGLLIGVPFLMINRSRSIALMDALHDVATLHMLGSLSPIYIPLGILLIIGTMALFLLYFPILEAQFGRTLGKRLMGLKVLKEKRTAIGMKEAFIRRISYYADILPVDALFIPFTEKKQRAFDIVAQTIVVRDPSYTRNVFAILAVLFVFAIPFFLLIGFLCQLEPCMKVTL